MANICITGIWHQGSVVSACLADLGHYVIGVCSHETAQTLNAGNPPVYEPGLPEMLKRNLEAGRLQYTTDYAQGLAGADLVFICTDTPVDTNDDSDLSSIYDIAQHIGQHLDHDLVLCVTAQVPIGTSSELAGILTGLTPAYQGGVAYIPEFLRLGIAVESFVKADRFVIGCDDFAVARRLAEIYGPLGRPVVFTDIRSAEMAKHASNAFLATSISFINEMADLCESLGANASEVSRILKLDQRIGRHAFLSPGLGFAGGTLGREIRALQKLGSARAISTPLMDAVWQINSRRPQLISHRLNALIGALTACQIGILGLTYKAGTSTMRRAVSLQIIGDLAAKGARIRAFDPLANLDEIEEPPPMEICADPYKVAQGSQALVLVTEWAGLEELDFPRMRREMHGDLFLDTRNLLDPARMRADGFRYFGIGR